MDASGILLPSMQGMKSPQHLMKRTHELVKDSCIDKNFKDFVEEMSAADQTWKFWVQFIFRDCFSYISLYLAVKCSNWKLRIASLKQMVPTFSVISTLNCTI